MKDNSVLLVLVLALGLLTLSTWRLLDRSDEAPLRGGPDVSASADDGTIPPSSLPSDSESEGEPSGIQVLDQPDAARAARWLPPVPSIDIVGLTGTQVLEAYWGSEWPSVRNHLETAAGGMVIRMLEEEWVGLEGSRLEGRDDFMLMLPELMRNGFNSSKINGISRALWTHIGPTIWANNHAHELVTDVVVRRVKDMDVALHTIDVRGVVERIKERHETEIQSSIDELYAIAMEADQLIIAFIQRDLQGVTEFTPPRFGTLFVCPITSVVHPIHARNDPSTIIAISTARDFWCANYSVEVDSIQGVMASFAEMEVRRRRLDDWLRSLAEVELGW
jgi:hypothetical protein